MVDQVEPYISRLAGVAFRPPSTFVERSTSAVPVPVPPNTSVPAAS